MKIVFMGSAGFSIPSLKKILTAHDVSAVVTNPDKPSGRGKKLQQTPVKIEAEKAGIPIIQPVKLTPEVIQEIAGYTPDIIVVVAYGKILPDALLAVPPRGVVNVHPSLLPHYRGAAPVPWSIINGETSTGVTIQFLSSQLDCGDIILQEETPIGETETAGELLARLANQGAICLHQALSLIEQGNPPRSPQSEGKYFYARKISPKDGKILWTEPAVSIYNLIRGMTPKPGAYTEYENRRLKILQANVVREIHEKPGIIAAADKNKGIIVGTGSGALQIIRLQSENSRMMTAQDFLNGHHLKAGDCFK